MITQPDSLDGSIGSLVPYSGAKSDIDLNGHAINNLQSLSSPAAYYCYGYYNGNFTYVGVYNGRPFYKDTSSWAYLWWNKSRWVLSYSLGSGADNGWVSTSENIINVYNGTGIRKGQYVYMDASQGWHIDSDGNFYGNNFYGGSFYGYFSGDGSGLYNVGGYYPWNQELYTWSGVSFNSVSAYGFYPYGYSPASDGGYSYPSYIEIHGGIITTIY